MARTVRRQAIEAPGWSYPRSRWIVRVIVFFVGERIANVRQIKSCLSEYGKTLACDLLEEGSVLLVSDAVSEYLGIARDEKGASS